MPNTKRGFGSAGLIIVVLIIIAGGAYLWSQKKSVPTDVSTATTTATALDTTGWKTYKHDKYGFEFKYPQNFQPVEGDVGVVGLNSDGIELNVNVNIDNDDINPGWKDEWQEYQPVEDIVIDNHRSQLFYLTYKSEKDTERYFLQIIEFTDRGRKYGLSISFTDSVSSSPVSGELVKQIFSTFRFVK